MNQNKLFGRLIVGLALCACNSDSPPSGELWLEGLQLDVYNGNHPECVAYCEASFDCYDYAREECFENCDYIFDIEPACSEEATEYVTCETIVRTYCGTGFNECADIGNAYNLCSRGPQSWSGDGMCYLSEYKHQQVYTTECKQLLESDGTFIEGECTCSNEEQTVTCTQPTLSCVKGDSCCATALP